MDKSDAAGKNGQNIQLQGVITVLPEGYTLICFSNVKLDKLSQICRNLF